MAARERARSWTALLVLGLVLIVYGTAVAVVVGSDESISIGTHSAPATARGLAVVTHPEITAFRDVDMEVTASAPGGVFLAASHRVDTNDLLATRSRYEITRMFVGDVDGGLLEDGPPARFTNLRPDRIVGWARLSPDHPTSATPDQLPASATLVVPLGDAPVDVVAFPVSPDDVVTLTIGVHAARAFTLHLALVAVGIVLVIAWWVLRRRRRGRTHRGSTSALVPVAAVALAASGCAVPSAQPVTATPAVRVAMTTSEATQVLGEPARAVHAVGFEAYPMWAVVQMPPNDPRRRTRLAVWTRAAFAKPWQRTGGVDLAVTPPPPGDPDRVTTKATRAAAVAATDAVASFWTTGKKPQSLRIDDHTRRARARLTRATAGSDLWVLGGNARDVRVAPVAGGHLAMISHRLHGDGAAPRRLTTAVMLRPQRKAEVLGSELTLTRR